MKTLRLLGMALLAVAISVGSIACSSDDNEEQQAEANLLGIWECTSTTPDDVTGEDHAFDPGKRLKFLKDNKCFIAYRSGEGFDTVNGEKENPTESDWDSEYGYKWLLSGNDFTVIESDLDRWVGTVTVEGNTMTFVYKFQRWSWDGQTMTSETEQTYTSVFTLRSRD